MRLRYHAYTLLHRTPSSSDPSHAADNFEENRACILYHVLEDRAGVNSAKALGQVANWAGVPSMALQFLNPMDRINPIFRPRNDFKPDGIQSAGRLAVSTELESFESKEGHSHSTPPAGPSTSSAVEQLLIVGSSGAPSSAHGANASWKDSALQPRTAYAMLKDENFQPGPRPGRFYAESEAWIFKEKVAKSNKRRSSEADTWKPGGIASALDLPADNPIVRVRCGSLFTVGSSTRQPMHRYRRYTLLIPDSRNGVVGATENRLQESKAVSLFQVVLRRPSAGQSAAGPKAAKAAKRAVAPTRRPAKKRRVAEAVGNHPLPRPETMVGLLSRDGYTSAAAALPGMLVPYESAGAAVISDGVSDIDVLAEMAWREGLQSTALDASVRPRALLLPGHLVMHSQVPMLRPQGLLRPASQVALTCGAGLALQRPLGPCMVRLPPPLLSPLHVCREGPAQ